MVEFFSTGDGSKPAPDSPTCEETQRLVTKIHDKWYDLTDFEKIHRGGPIALGLAAGRDGTVMFESHHPFTHRRTLEAILEKYELDEDSSRHLITLEEKHGIAEHRFNWKSEFGDALKFHAKQYFEAEAKRRKVSLRGATKATPERWFELAVIGVIFTATFVSLIRGYWISLFTCPLTSWMLGVNSFHDAAHFALHKDWRINRFATYLVPHFSSPFAWYHQHNIGHHSYPNVAHRDPDLRHFSSQKREHKSVRWSPAHKQQSSWVFLLVWWNLAVEIGLGTTDDIWMLMSKVYNDSLPMKVVSTNRLYCHVMGRVLCIATMHIWPFLIFDSWTRCIIFATVPYFVFSFLFMMNTQINHLSPETAHATDQDWYKHQVVTAQDFGVGSKFCYLLSGGLNYQIVHHLFPTVNHCHLVKLQPIVARLCKEHGVEYKEVPGYAAAIKAHHLHTVQMSFRDS